MTGEGRIVGDNAGINANPRAVEWGSAPILVQSTRRAGRIHIHAEVQFPGAHAPQPADLDIESVPAEMPFVLNNGVKAGDENTAPAVMSAAANAAVTPVPTARLTDKQKADILKEVEQQQADFGIK